MPKKTKNRKFIIATIGIVIIVAVALFSQQKIVYDHGSNSFIFGEKLSYTQNQSMPVRGLLFTVQKISYVPFTPYAMANCLDISQNTLKLRCMQANDLRYTHNQTYRASKQYLISLSAHNTQNSVTRLSNYRFSFDGRSVTILQQSIDKNGIEPGASGRLTVQIRVPQATHNVDLLVTDNMTTKYFKLSL